VLCAARTKRRGRFGQFSRPHECGRGTPRGWGGWWATGQGRCRREEGVPRCSGSTRVLCVVGLRINRRYVKVGTLAYPRGPPRRKCLGASLCKCLLFCVHLLPVGSPPVGWDAGEPWAGSVFRIVVSMCTCAVGGAGNATRLRRGASPTTSRFKGSDSRRSSFSSRASSQPESRHQRLASGLLA